MHINRLEIRVQAFHLTNSVRLLVLLGGRGRKERGCHLRSLLRNTFGCSLLKSVCQVIFYHLTSNRSKTHTMYI